MTRLRKHIAGPSIFDGAAASVTPRSDVNLRQRLGNPNCHRLRSFPRRPL